MPTLHKVLTAANTPTQITGASVGFTSATFWGYSGRNAQGLELNNTSNVYLGVKSGEMIVTLSSGSYFNWNLVPRNQKDDLSNFWVQGTQGDGVYVVYYP